jgi:hypothetical protein
MTPALLAPLAAAVLVLVVVVTALVAARASRRRWQAQLDAARGEIEALGARVDALSARPDPAPVPGAAAHEFVITTLPEGTEAADGTVAVTPPSPALTAGQFTSVAVGESLVRVLSFGHGVRRALSAENRNRIRFEVRREVKRSRRQRRRDLKEARRHLREVDPRGVAEDAA